MTDQQQQDEPASGSAPSDDRPAPRPDPYAQFGNPLNDTWGTNAAPTTTAPSTGRVTTRRRRPWVKRAAIAAAVIALAVVVWLAREPLADAWDRVYDALSDALGADTDSGSSPAEPGASTTAADGSGSPGSGEPGSDAATVDERFEALEKAREEAFATWLDDNDEVLGEAADAIHATDDRMSALQEALDSGAPVEIGAHRQLMRERLGAALGVARVLDTAPSAKVPDGFMTLMLLQADEANQMIDAIDRNDDASFRAAAGRLSSARSEVGRLCNQYDDAPDALCR